MLDNAIGTIVIAGDARVPALGCGTWQLRGERCATIVAEALRLGFRHIDTAQGYGNEAAVGDGIRASDVPRETVFVTTKVMPHLISDGPLQRSVEESLKRLRIERIDLQHLVEAHTKLYIHTDPPYTQLEHTVDRVIKKRDVLIAVKA